MQKCVGPVKCPSLFLPDFCFCVYPILLERCNVVVVVVLSSCLPSEASEHLLGYACVPEEYIVCVYTVQPVHQCRLELCAQWCQRQTIN